MSAFTWLRLSTRVSWRALIGARLALLPSLVAIRGAAVSTSVLLHLGLATIAAHHVRGVTGWSKRATQTDVVEVTAPILLPDTPTQDAPRVDEGSIRSRHRSSQQPVAHNRPVAPLAPVSLDADSSEPVSVLATESTGAPRFVMGTVAPARLTSGVVTQDAHGATGAGLATRAPIDEHVAEVAAKLLTGAPPAYTTAAQNAGIEADLPLEIVVDGSGNVTQARCLSHVGYGLDEVALRAIRGYRFTPARRSGQAVAVRMRWLMHFQLR